MQRALRERRVAASFSQAELAREAGVSRAQISAIESARHVPSVTTALALARALDVPLEELFPGAPVEAVPVVEPARDRAPLRLGRVGDRLVYAALPHHGAGAELFRAPDAVLRDGRVQILPGSETRGVVLVGCDPSLGMMADLLPTRGHRAVPVHATTADARRALAAGRCHAALVHGRSVDLRRRPDHDEPLFPGAREALSALDRPDVLLGIATGKGRRGLLHVLEHHGLVDRFATLKTADDGPGKPHPAILEEAMAELGVDPVDTVMVGDTVFDVQMARNARVEAIGVAWGYHEAEELMAAGAGCVIETFAALLPALSMPEPGGPREA